MPQLTLTNDQVVELVRQLPPIQKREVLRSLASDAQTRRAERMTYAEDRLRTLATARGLAWDDLDEDAREAFIEGTSYRTAEDTLMTGLQTAFAAMSAACSAGPLGPLAPGMAAALAAIQAFISSATAAQGFLSPKVFGE